MCLGDRKKENQKERNDAQKGKIHVCVGRVPLVREFHFQECFLYIIFCWSRLVFLPGKLFLRFLEMYSNFMHLIKSKAKLDTK